MLMMTPLGTIFRSGSNKPPKIDQHGLFTSIQVSVPVLEGDLQVYEPWKRKRSRPKECHVTLYVNETSPFLVWHKLEKGRNLQNIGSGSTNDSSPTAPSSRPRCVIPVSRAKLVKTTGGSFEMTDFASNLTFRFIATTIREAKTWVEKLAEESLREANLDMRSICSSCSSYTSSTSSFPSPDESSTDQGNRFFTATNTDTSAFHTHRKSASFTATTGSIMQLLNDKDSDPNQLQSPGNKDEKKLSEREEDRFAVKSTEAHITACRLGHTRSNSKTFPRAQCSRFSSEKQHQQHMRAQPHLGLNVMLDKHRPELRNVIPDIKQGQKVQRSLSCNRSELPFSEYFVNVPNT